MTLDKVVRVTIDEYKRRFFLQWSLPVPLTEEQIKEVDRIEVVWLMNALEKQYGPIDPSSTNLGIFQLACLETRSELLGHAYTA